MYKFSREIISKALDFQGFLNYSEKIISENQPQCAPYNDTFFFSYTVACHKRRLKILNNIQLNKKLYNEISDGISNWTWILIDEPWCGDASFIDPILQAMSIASMGEINMKIILRDENPEIMEQYLTDNSKSIPKLICLDSGLNELGTWGPRPEKLQHLVKNWMQEKIDMNEKIKRVHRWYKNDNSLEVQKEFIDLIKYWKTKQKPLQP
jgi:hypothetical protein